jgi:hypothetical protein
MSYLSYDDTFDWSAITDIDVWLDRATSMDYHDQPLAQDWGRVCKIIEEAGEAVNELILFTGQNPRKPRTTGDDKLMDELADVAYTAILAIQHFTKDDLRTREILRDRGVRLVDRMRSVKHIKQRIWSDGDNTDHV